MPLPTRRLFVGHYISQRTVLVVHAYELLFEFSVYFEKIIRLASLSRKRPRGLPSSKQVGGEFTCFWQNFHKVCQAEGRDWPECAQDISKYYTKSCRSRSAGSNCWRDGLFSHVTMLIKTTTNDRSWSVPKCDASPILRGIHSILLFFTNWQNRFWAHSVENGMHPLHSTIFHESTESTLSPFRRDWNENFSKQKQLLLSPKQPVKRVQEAKGLASRNTSAWLVHVLGLHSDRTRFQLFSPWCVVACRAGTQTALALALVLRGVRARAGTCICAQKKSQGICRQIRERKWSAFRMASRVVHVGDE